MVTKFSRAILPISLTVVVATCAASAEPMPLIRISDDGVSFVRGDFDSPQPFRIWGVNYDHDGSGRLLDEYWIDEWETVVEDFAEIKRLGANCVRVHLQFGKFMDSADRPNQASLRQLAKLLTLAQNEGLYLNLTGLACYHKQNIPDWYDVLDEQERWTAQARFWESIARTCQDSPAVFCYDLMNEPILPGKEPATEWLAGELAGKYFVQRLTLDLRGRSRQQVAGKWTKTMTDAIRRHDERHLITVGVIPWVFVFGGGKPLFYSPPVVDSLDFVSVHFYPKKGEVDKAVDALQAYDVGKPLVVEEMFPLRCTTTELREFIHESRSRVDGWFSFYWGTTASELRSKQDGTIADAITAEWLDTFKAMSAEFKPDGG